MTSQYWRRRLPRTSGYLKGSRVDGGPVEVSFCTDYLRHPPYPNGPEESSEFSGPCTYISPMPTGIEWSETPLGQLPRGWRREEARHPETGLPYGIRLVYVPSVWDRIVIGARRVWECWRRAR